MHSDDPRTNTGLSIGGVDRQPVAAPISPEPISQPQLRRIVGRRVNMPTVLKIELSRPAAMPTGTAYVKPLRNVRSQGLANCVN